MHILMGARVCHLCSSRQVVMRLRILAKNELSLVEDFLGDTSSPDGNNDFFQGVQYTLQTNGSHWTIIVPQQNKLAGHYLLTSAGHLHFQAARPATTNDYVLQDWSQ
jgi:hypothetical protein